MAQLTTRLALRTDTIENWNKNLSVVLENGEIAIVRSNGKNYFKVGDGASKYEDLKYTNEQGVDLTSNNITSKSFSQGINALAVPYGLAAGAYISANANFSQALGFNSQTSSNDDYSFVWNGDDSRAIGDYYYSHGKGSFSVNPKDGLSGFYIGESNIEDIIDDHVNSKCHYVIVENSQESGSTFSNSAINLVVMSETEQTFHMPEKQSNYARDFLVRVECPSTLTSIGGIAFDGITSWEGDSLNFEAGKNYILTFTETKYNETDGATWLIKSLELQIH